MVGDIPDGIDDVEEEEIMPRDENSWYIDGQCSIYEFKRYFGIELDKEIEKDYVTVSGLFFYEIDTLPNIGDTVEIEDLILEIIDKDGNRIDKILAYRNNSPLAATNNT